MNKAYLAIIILLPLLVISGCIGNQNVRVDPNNGILINEFSVDPTVAEPDDIVRFYLDIENCGGTTAKCITAELFGIESWYDMYGQPMSYSRPWADRGMMFNYFNTGYNSGMQFSYWDYNKGYMNLAYNQYSGLSLSAFVSNSWDSFMLDFCNSYGTLSTYQKDIKYWDSMSPPYPERNRAGQAFTTQWELRPPVLPEGVSVPYPVTARISYMYTSTAHMNVKAFNKDYYKILTDSGKPIENPLIIQNSHASPIQVVVTSSTAPIVVNERQPGIELANYRIELQNVGDGWPMATTPGGESGFMFATLTLNGPGAFFYDCLGYTSGQEIFLQGDIIENIIKLRSDKRAPFGCTIGIDRSQWMDTPMGTISLTFQIYYRYYIDKEIQVTVKGIERY